jgi:hypothetical protein
MACLFIPLDGFVLDFGQFKSFELSDITGKQTFCEYSDGLSRWWK